MKTRTAANNRNSNPGRGPSLYGVESPSKDPLEGLSILGALEPRRSRVGKRGLLAVLTVLLLLSATYLVAPSSVLRQSIPLLALATPGFEAGTMKGPIPSSASVPAVVIAPSPVAEVAGVATITTEPSADKAASQEAFGASYPETGLSQAQLAVVVAPKAEPAPGPAAVGLESVTGVGPRQIPRRNDTKNPSVATTARVKRTDAGRQARAPAIASRDNKKAEKGNDKDIDLIAALLTHISRTGASSKDGTSKLPRTSAPSVTLAGSASKREGGAHNRDIVMQASDESRESLIGRCRSLGLLEGELCRIRICSGSWGSDQACSLDTAVRGD